MTTAHAQKTSLPQVHGHRGSRGTHPENTIPAFKEAVAVGADVLELDLQLTKDDVPVLSHDPMLSPEMCQYMDGKPLKASIAIRSLNARELAQFDCGSKANPRFKEQKAIAKTNIPTLEEFLLWATANAPKLHFNIETKMTAPEPKWVAPPELFADRVVATLKKYRAVDKTILQSFDFRTLRAAHKLEPSLRLSCLFETEKNFCALTKAENAAFASPDKTLVTKAEVDACHKLGIQVVPWTANTPDEWKKLIDAGVDAIISDYPRKLVHYLNERKS